MLNTNPNLHPILADLGLDPLRVGSAGKKQSLLIAVPARGGGCISWQLPRTIWEKSTIACERGRIFGCRFVSAENNVCEPEPGNDFCDVMSFVSPWPIRFHDRMKLECSSQLIPRTVVLGLRELNCDSYVTEIVSWLGFADVIFGGDKRQPEIRLRSQAKRTTARFD